MLWEWLSATSRFIVGFCFRLQELFNFAIAPHFLFIWDDGRKTWTSHDQLTNATSLHFHRQNQMPNHQFWVVQQGLPKSDEVFGFPTSLSRLIKNLYTVTPQKELGGLCVACKHTGTTTCNHQFTEIRLYTRGKNSSKTSACWPPLHVTLSKINGWFTWKSPVWKWTSSSIHLNFWVPNVHLPGWFPFNHCWTWKILETPHWGHSHICSKNQDTPVRENWENWRLKQHSTKKYA